MSVSYTKLLYIYHTQSNPSQLAGIDVPLWVSLILSSCTQSDVMN